MTLNEYLIEHHILTTEQAASFIYLGENGLMIIEGLLSNSFGSMEIVYDDTIIETLETLIQTNSNLTLLMNDYKYNKLYSSINYTYDALKPINIIEENTGTRGNESTSTGNSTNTNTPAKVLTTSKMAYDSVSFSDTDKTIESGTETNANEAETTNNNTETLDLTNTTIGNNGNIQDIIKNERIIADFSFYAEIARDIREAITIPIFIL